MSYIDYLRYLDNLNDPNSDIYDLDLYNFYIDDRRNFLIYDDLDNSKNLKYCKLNLNFSALNSSDKMKEFAFDPKDYKKIFRKFLELNMGSDTDYIFKPYLILPEYEQYFDPIRPEQIDYLNYYGMKITINSIMYVKAPGYVRIHDWVVSDKNTFIKYSKYNFNFEKWSNDFRIYGSKLLIFSDFLSRNYIAPISLIFDVYEQFLPYFFNLTDQVQNYILTQGLISSYEFADRSDKNIDLEYFKKSSANEQIIIDLKNQFPDYDTNSDKYIMDYIYAFGQFELIDLAYKSNRQTALDLIKKVVCTVYLNTSTKSHSTCGFLYKKKDSIYVVTSYDIIQHKPNAERLYCLFENDKINQLIEFRIIGFDKVSNVLMGYYNPTSQHNLNHKVNLDYQIFININFTDFNNLNSPVYVVANMEENDNLTMLTATIMKTNYGGGFSINNSNEIIPESMVINSFFYDTVNGSPVFAATDPNDLKTFTIISMITNMFGKNNSNYVLALQNKMLYLIISSILSKWSDVVADYPDIDIISNNIVDSYIRNGFPKAWLGIDGLYYNYNSKFTYPELNNFSYMGGLIVRNIICGYDTIKNKFIYDGSQNSNKAIIKLYSPLENTLIHKRIVESGIPIIIKSIKLLNLITDTPMILNLGKYGSQKSYSEYVYGQQYSETLPIIQSERTYTNNYIYLFNPIIISYYFYNGSIWLEESIQIGSNETEFYVDYSNNDLLYKQNKFEYPEILYNYQKFFNVNF